MRRRAADSLWIWLEEKKDGPPMVDPVGEEVGRPPVVNLARGKERRPPHRPASRVLVGGARAPCVIRAIVAHLGSRATSAPQKGGRARIGNGGARAPMLASVFWEEVTMERERERSGWMESYGRAMGGLV